MGDEQRLPPDELIARAREQFETATDFTVAVEEEFALVDPETYDLTNRFEEVQAASRGTALEEHLVGELIASEVSCLHRFDSRRSRRATVGFPVVCDANLSSWP